MGVHVLSGSLHFKNKLGWTILFYKYTHAKHVTCWIVEDIFTKM